MVSSCNGLEGRGKGLVDLDPSMGEVDARLLQRLHPHCLDGAGLGE